MLQQPSSSQALVIGVTQYQQVKRLSPNRDAIDLRDALLNYCGYSPAAIQLLEEGQATRGAILLALQRLRETATPTSRTFLYFSGHGGQRRSSAYLVPVDARPEELESTAISAQLLAEQLRGCAGEVTVVLDCCYAAGMASDLEPFNESLRSSLVAGNRVVLAASRKDDFSFGAKHEPYGVFTGHLIAGLCGKASRDGKDVGVHHLFEYVQKQVVLDLRMLQRPMFIASTERFYPLTRYPRDVEPSPIFERDVYVAYDSRDFQLEDWAERTLLEPFREAGISIWSDQLGDATLREEAVVKSKYILPLLTKSYLDDHQAQLTATMAILQAVNARAPRFIPIKRDDVAIPLAMQAFVGLEMTDANLMSYDRLRKRLIARLKQDPYVR